MQSTPAEIRYSNIPVAIKSSTLLSPEIKSINTRQMINVALGQANEVAWINELQAAGISTSTPDKTTDSIEPLTSLMIKIATHIDNLAVENNMTDSVSLAN